MDNETEKLQHEVLSRFGWGYEDGENPYKQINSDYLLLRLEEHAWIELTSSRTAGWRITYELHTKDGYDGVHGKTPLIALLKLALKLHEAGELRESK